MNLVAEGAADLDARRLPTGQPLVLRGALRGWRAVGRWSPSYLATAAPEWRVPVAELRGGKLVLDRQRGLQLVRRPLGEIVERFDGYAMPALDELPAALRADIGEPAVCQGAPWRSAKLWVAAPGAVTPLHFDVAHNVHALLHGRKRFLLYPRTDWFRLYPEPLASGVPNFSRVDPTGDPGRFPRFRRARPLTCTLESGDALLIPGGVWHHVTSETETVAVNFWWARGLHALAAGLADRLKRRRGLSR